MPESISHINSDSPSSPTAILLKFLTLRKMKDTEACIRCWVFATALLYLFNR